MSKYKYTNLNPFPIYLPCERGGQCMIRTGESTTKSWFSRFTGNRQLTRVPLSHEISEPISLPPEILAAPPIHTQPVGPVKSFDDKETKQYKCRKGIYSCKLCGIFQTGSSESMKAHLEQAHGNASKVAKPEPKFGDDDGEGDKKIVSSTESTASTVKKDESEPGGKKDEPVILVPVVPVEEVFTCDFPGCGKEFKSNRGLTMHKTRVHR